MDHKAETIDTYNKSADALARKFDSQGARTEDINYVFSFCSKGNPSVLEVGCGNGRDAEEICKRTNDYEGVDISEGLLSLAKKRLPERSFTLADIETFAFPSNVDIVFAFASLIHVPQESFARILQRVFSSLNNQGLIFISLKHSPEYQEITKMDEFGTRTYWHYSQGDIEKIAHKFSILSVSIKDVRGQAWMDVLLQKK